MHHLMHDETLYDHVTINSLTSDEVDRLKRFLDERRDLSFTFDLYRQMDNIAIVIRHDGCSHIVVHTL